MDYATLISWSILAAIGWAANGAIASCSSAGYLEVLRASRLGRLTLLLLTLAPGIVLLLHLWIFAVLPIPFLILHLLRSCARWVWTGSGEETPVWWGVLPVLWGSSPDGEVVEDNVEEMVPKIYKGPSTGTFRRDLPPDVRVQDGR